MNVDHDDKNLVNRIGQALIAGESLYAIRDVEDDNFVAITDLRLLFSSAAEIISVPYSQITAVAANKGEDSLAGGRQLRVVAGTHAWSFVLVQPRKLQETYTLIMRNVLQHEASGMSLRL